MRIEKRWLIFLAAIFAAFWPVWRWYVLRTVDGSDESYGIVALIIAAFYGWKFKSRISFSNRQAAISMGLLMLYGLTFSVLPPLLRAVFAIGVVAVFFGPAFRSPGIIGLMFLSLPVVASLQFYAGFPLRVLAAGFSTTALTLMQYDIVRTGTDLVYLGKVIGVDAPCSGIQTLYTSLVIVFSVAAFSHLTWWRTGQLCGAGIVVAVLGNALRVTVLFFKESGIWSLPEWTHQGIGVLIFGGVVGVIFVLGSKLAGSNDRPPVQRKTDMHLMPNRWLVVASLVMALFAGAVPFAGTFVRSHEVSATEAVWPKKWKGEWLEPMPLTRREAVFAEGFPGKIGVFQAGENRVILRTVNRATRKLHSSADCLKATGYEVTNNRPGDFKAVRGSERFEVFERVYESGIHSEREWADISGWFWDAALNRTEGPWLAITVISPERVHDQTLSVR